MGAEWDMPMDKGFHPAVEIFPEMSAEDFAEFREDIKARGLMVPIVTTPDGLILDGRHRWRACMELKVEPRYQVYSGDPWLYVVSANLHRRHLTTSQRAMVADRLRTATVGRPTRRGENRAQKLPENRELAVTRDQAARILRVGHATLDVAGRVNRKGAPELVAAVDDGTVNLHVADRVASLSQEDQKEWVKEVRAGRMPAKVPKGNIVQIPSQATEKRFAADRIKSNVFSKKDAEGLSSTLTGLQVAFQAIDSVDGISQKEAEFLDKEIGKAKTVLNRLQKLMKEVITDGQ